MSSRFVILSAVAASLAIVSVSANGVALRPGRTTDASVCDLGPHTTGFIASQTLVPASADSKDKIAVYARMAGTFITEQCTNGQTLILHGSTDVDSDRPSLEEVAHSSCRVADVRRSEGQAADGPYTYTTFELRCTITKLDELRTKLRDLEAKEPLGALKARVARSGGPREGTASSESRAEKKDCGKLTLGSLLQGGACK